MSTDLGQFNFEVYDRRSAPLAKTPQVTFQRGGAISFNASAYNAMGSPTSLELLYDRDRQVVAFRSVGPDEPHAYPMRPVGASAKTYIVNGRSFFAYYSIDISVPYRYVPQIIEGKAPGEMIAIVDLNGPRQSAVSNRARGAQKAAANGSEDSG